MPPSGPSLFWWSYKQTYPLAQFEGAGAAAAVPALTTIKLAAAAKITMTVPALAWFNLTYLSYSQRIGITMISGGVLPEVGSGLPYGPALQKTTVPPLA